MRIKENLTIGNRKENPGHTLFGGHLVTPAALALPEHNLHLQFPLRTVSVLNKLTLSGYSREQAGLLLYFKVFPGSFWK